MPGLRRALLAATALVVIAVAGCAHPANSTLTPEIPVSPPPVDSDWRDFPVDRTPRPVVLLGSMAKHTGYTTGEAKLAATTGKLTLDAPLPSGTPGPRPVALPDGTRELPLIGAQNAFDELRANPDGKSAADTKPLRVTRVELGSAAFATDRGEVVLPAWLFYPEQSLGPIAWPALGLDAFWHPGTVLPAISGATLSAAGRTVTLQAPAAPTPCPGEPATRLEPVTTSTSVTVTVSLREVPTRSSTHGGCIHDAMLRLADYTVTLDAPLGNRVLLDGQGHVYAVRVSR